MSTCRTSGCAQPPNGSGHCAEHKRHLNLAYRYGLTPGDYEKLFAKQNGKCAACTTTDAPLVVDHDHTTGLVRGLLCSNCNRALGMFRDDAATLTRLVRYLTKPPAARVLDR